MKNRNPITNKNPKIESSILYLLKVVIARDETSIHDTP